MSSAMVEPAGSEASFASSSALDATTASAPGGGNGASQSSSGTHFASPSFARRMPVQPCSAVIASHAQPSSEGAKPSAQSALVTPTGWHSGTESANLISVESSRLNSQNPQPDPASDHDKEMNHGQL